MNEEREQWPPEGYTVFTTEENRVREPAPGSMAEAWANLAAAARALADAVLRALGARR